MEVCNTNSKAKAHWLFRHVSEWVAFFFFNRTSQRQLKQGSTIHVNVVCMLLSCTNSLEVQLTLSLSLYINVYNESISLELHSTFYFQIICHFKEGSWMKALTLTYSTCWTFVVLVLNFEVSVLLFSCQHAPNG